MDGFSRYNQIRVLPEDQEKQLSTNHVEPLFMKKIWIDECMRKFTEGNGHSFC